MITRRNLLFGGASLGIGGAIAYRFLPPYSQNKLSHQCISCGLDDKGNGVFAWVSGKEVLHQFNLPGRGHDVSFDPVNQVAAICARRPGNWLFTFDLKAPDKLSEIDVPQGYYCNGHVEFANKGNTLLVSLTEESTGLGYIAAYDLQAAKLSKVLPSYGVDPHQFALLSDGKALVVANGGFLKGKNGKPMDFKAIDSSLAYVDLDTGALLEQVRLEDSYNSLRHLTVAPDDEVFVLCQYQKEAEIPALFYRHERGKQLSPLKYSAAMSDLMKGYGASVAVNTDKTHVVTTAPKAGRYFIWDLSGLNKPYVGTLADTAGVLWNEDEGVFVVSNSVGQMHMFKPGSPDGVTYYYYAGVHWDNHMVNITA